jgi:hypothetical protein
MPRSGGSPGASPVSRHWRVPRLEDELHAPLRRRSAKHVRVLHLERGEGRVVVAGEAQLHIRQAKRREVQLRAVAEDLYTLCEVAIEERRRSAGPAVASVLPGRGTFRRLESCKLGVVRLHGARPSL